MTDDPDDQKKDGGHAQEGAYQEQPGRGLEPLIEEVAPAYKEDHRHNHLRAEAQVGAYLPEALLPTP